MDGFTSDYRAQKIRRERFWRWLNRLLWALAIIALIGIAKFSNASVDKDIQALAVENEMMDKVDFLPWEEPPVMVCHWSPRAEVTLVIINGEPELVPLAKK